MNEKVYDLGSYIENPPSILDILPGYSKNLYPNLPEFLKSLRDQLLPLLGKIYDAIEQARNQLEDSQKIERNKQILGELQNLEKECLWAQFIELEAQGRAITDLIQKLEGEISVNSIKEGEIRSSLSSIRPQFQQKNDTVQTEFKKFRAINAELQQLFKDQNQILRKINQIESQLNNPKAKPTPEETSTLEKELEGLHTNEQETRHKLPQKQKELEAQRLLHQQKEKELRPLKIKFDGLVAEEAKLDQMVKIDKSRLGEKQKEFSEISNKMKEFLKGNNIDPKNRPSTIRTRNIIEGKIKAMKANMGLYSENPQEVKFLFMQNNRLLPSFQKLLDLLETLQSNQVQKEVRSISKEIETLRKQLTPKFSNIMNEIGRKGGVQVRSLISSSGLLRFIENGKETSVASILAFLLTIYGGKTNQIKIDSHNLSTAQMEDLNQILKVLQSKTDSDIKITEV